MQTPPTYHPQTTNDEQLKLVLSSFKKEKVQFSFQPWKAEYSLGAAFLLKAELCMENLVIFRKNCVQPHFSTEDFFFFFCLTNTPFSVSSGS